MNRDEARSLLGELLHHLAPEADLQGIDDDAPLQEALDLDSMDFLNLVAALHEATGLAVPERDYPALASVGGFVDYVADRSGAP